MINEGLAQRYRYHRRHDVPWARKARFAMAMARYDLSPGMEWDDSNRNGDPRLRFSQDGFDLVATCVPDRDYDPDDCSPLTIEEATEYLQKAGFSRGQVPEMAREEVRRYEALRKEAIAVGVVVVAYRGGVELGQSSLWGIELGDRGEDDPYLKEVVDEVAYEAIEEAKKSLVRLCGSFEPVAMEETR